VTKRPTLKQQMAKAVTAPPSSPSAMDSAFKSDKAADRPRYEKRLTLDLTVEQHRALKVLSAECGTAMADVLRAALAELFDDDQLRARVLKRLALE